MVSAAFRPPAFASRSSDTRRGVGPSSRSAYRPTRDRTPNGITAFRTHELRPGEDVLYTARTAVLIPTERGSRPAPAASPCTRRTSHRPGSRRRRHQRGFRRFARPVFPPPVAARIKRGAVGHMPRASHPADQEPTTHPEEGIDHRARTWNDRSLHIVDLQSSSSLNACDLASHATVAIARAPGAEREIGAHI